MKEREREKREREREHMTEVVGKYVLFIS